MKEKLKCSLWIIIIASAILPVFVADFYAGPCADDFTQIASYKISPVKGLPYILGSMIDICKSWQGTYFSNFILSMPVFNYFGIVGLRIWLFVRAAAFFTSAITLIHALRMRISSDKKTDLNEILMIMAISLIYILGFNSLEDSFFWFNGSSVYLAPTTCSLIAIACYVYYEINTKVTYIVVGIIFAFLGAGGALCIPGAMCSAFLLLIIDDVLENKRINRNAIIAAVAFIGALINTLSPGNFARKEARNPGANPIIAAINTVYKVNGTVSTEVRSGVLIAVFAIVFFMAYRANKPQNRDFSHPILFALLCYLGVFLTDVPVIYGFGKGEFMPERCLFIERVSIMLFVSLCAGYLGCWADIKGDLHFSKEQVIIIAIICFVPLSSYISIHNLENLTPYKMILHMVGNENDFEINAKRQKNMIDQIINSDKDDVIVYSDRPSEDEWCNTREISLFEDPAAWVNNYVAIYYDKNTVTLKYTE